MTWTAGARISTKKRNRKQKPITRHMRRPQYVRAAITTEDFPVTNLLSTLGDAATTATPAVVATTPKKPTRAASNDGVSFSSTETDDLYSPNPPPSPHDPEDIKVMEYFDNMKAGDYVKI